MAQKGNAELVESVWERRWRERIEGWRRSGQRQQEYCQANGISVSSFSHWKGKLAKLDQLRKETAGKVAASGGVSKRSSEPLRWSEVRMPMGAGRAEMSQEGSGFEVVVASGWSVRLGPRFEAESLRRLLVVLKELSC
jgi:hypothetical protein